MVMPPCSSDYTRASGCRDSLAAYHLKLLSIFLIFFTSVLGISLPVILARLFHGKPVYDKAILVIKCFAAGVILSTSLVHVLPDAYQALSDCQVASRHPWKDFPFSGLVTMLGALLALLVDVTATSHVDHAHYNPVGTQEQVLSSNSLRADAHVKSKESTVESAESGASMEERGDEELARLKQKLVSQVLEIGIIFHSVIIGVTMGMSQNRCTIRPLVAALSFHQIFEGMGLGGCIAQAGFSVGTTAYMSFLFSVTTPMGIVLGMILFSVTGYDDSSPNALIMEGLLGSVSSGILIYMALVDLIAVDFFHNKMMSSNPLLKKVSFVAHSRLCAYVNSRFMGLKWKLVYNRRWNNGQKYHLKIDSFALAMISVQFKLSCSKGNGEILAGVNNIFCAISLTKTTSSEDARRCVML